ncbi:MAG: enoyl-CoA hydratase/isomerase family protein [Halobacteriales archaeon]
MQVELEHLTVEQDDQIARITLNRPERLNAMHHEATRDFDAVTQLIEDDLDVRLVTIQGEGRAFCSGIDLKEMAAGNISMDFFPPWERAMRRLELMDAIVICLMHGYSIGGGLQIGLASDIRVATPSSEMGLTAIEESFLPGLGTWRLARYIGHGRAKKLNILGNLIDGEEARRIGLVDHLVDEDTMDEEFEELVERYMVGNSKGARLTKRATVDAFDLDYEDFLELYLDLQQRAFDHPDHDEAKAAMREDREPEWE